MSIPIDSYRVGQNLIQRPKYNGMVCEILDEFFAHNFSGDVVKLYCVQWEDGQCSMQQGFQLSKNLSEEQRDDILIAKLEAYNLIERLCHE